MKPQNKTTGGPRRELKNLSEMRPPAKLPMIPKMQSSRPQWWVKNSAPGCSTSWVKMVYQFMMPLRSTPEVNSMAAIRSISGLQKTRFSRSPVVSSSCMWPDEASWVSRWGKPASSGVSLINQRSSTTHNNNTTPGRKNTAQVASTPGVPATKTRRNRAESHPVAWPEALVMLTMAWPQSKAKYTPNEINVPKMAPKTPRSRTWNQ